MIMLEAAKATTETVDALRTGAAAMKAMQKATLVLILNAFLDSTPSSCSWSRHDYLSCPCRNIDDVDKTMDEINEQTENMKQIQEALSAPLGASADFDEVIHCRHLRFAIFQCIFF